MTNLIVTVYEDAGGFWRWRIQNYRNKKIIGASTESYTKRAAAIKNLFTIGDAVYNLDVPKRGAFKRIIDR